jgi:hypothetical protein
MNPPHRSHPPPMLRQSLRIRAPTKLGEEKAFVTGLNKSLVIFHVLQQTTEAGAGLYFNAETEFRL